MRPRLVVLKTWYASLRISGRPRVANSGRLTGTVQEVDETPDYTDSDTNPNTTASSVVGESLGDSRKRRTEANQLRRSIFGKKHDRLGESKASEPLLSLSRRGSFCPHANRVPAGR